MVYIVTMRIVIRDVPPEVHRDLKVIVAQKGTSIQQTLINLITEYVEQNRSNK